MKVAYLNN